MNSQNSNTIGMDMQTKIDGGDFTSTLSIKQKCKNFDDMKKRLRVNKNVILQPYKLRLST